MDLFVRLAADATLIAIAVVGIFVVLRWCLNHGWWRNAPVVVMAGFTSLLIGKVCSLLYQPEIARPFLKLGTQPGAAYINNPGFPSDHALLATVIVVAVYATTKHKVLTLFLAALVIIMSAARVIALVHTPLDVIGGILAGLAGVFWYKKLTN